MSGYNREGFDRYGYDRYGFNKSGYDIKGYNSKGTDRAGYTKSDYMSRINEVSEKIKEAHKFMKKNDFESACLKLRKGYEIGIKCIISHNLGNYCENSLHKNIVLCRRYGLINENYYNELLEAKRICNIRIHNDNGETGNFNSNNIEYRHLHFCCETLKKVKDYMEKNTQ